MFIIYKFISHVTLFMIKLIIPKKREFKMVEAKLVKYCMCDS